MTATMEEANAALRQAVEQRREAQAAGRQHDAWYGEPATKPMHFVTSDEAPYQQEIHDHHLHRAGMTQEELDAAIQRLSRNVHPTSQAFFDLCDGLKEMHRRKSADYGCPSGEDPLLNIRNGAKFVGIPAWKAAMVRLSDKVTRLATFNATGSLHNEGVIDTLEDLASYSLLALLLYREEQDA